jgi:hypothetical protein
MAAQDGARAGCDSGCSGVYTGFGMQAVAEVPPPPPRAPPYNTSFPSLPSFPAPSRPVCAQGLITEKEVDASLRRLLRPHFELGDPTEHMQHLGLLDLKVA